MPITHRKLVNYLRQSPDWLHTGERKQWLTFDGPPDDNGHPIQIVLPRISAIPNSMVYITTAIATLAKCAGISTETMVDRITPTSVQALLDTIKHFNSDPGVFTVQLLAGSHLAGYDAYLDFRCHKDHAHRSLSAHADTPTKALRSLLDTLQAKWGPCPVCGHPLAGKPTREATS